MNKAADYGPLLGGLLGALGPTFTTGHLGVPEAVLNYTYYGLWGGDAEGDLYHHINTSYLEQTAAYTQAEWTINESWAIKFGLRYAEDTKDVRERRGYYFENFFPFLYIGPDAPGMGATWDYFASLYGLMDLSLIHI